MQFFSYTTVAPGGSTIQIDVNGSIAANNVLALSALARDGGGTVNINLLRWERS